MRPTGCHGDKADKARLLTLIIPLSHKACATQSPLNREVLPTVHCSLHRREGLLRGDLREEEGMQRQPGTTKRPGKDQGMELREAQGEREELREGTDRRIKEEPWKSPEGLCGY